MRLSAGLLLGVALWLAEESPAECVQQGGAYEGFRLTRVSVQTPLEFPIRWVEKALLGRVIESLDAVTASLPLKPGGIFHFADHVAAMEAIRDRNSYMRPGQRIGLTLVIPSFPACDMTAHTVEVVYHAYSTDAAYFASRLLDVWPGLPDRSLAVSADRPPPRRLDPRENTNESISALEVRAVFPDGTTEVMPTAIALRKARDMGLDLLLVAPMEVPPVARAVDLGHYTQVDESEKQSQFFAIPFAGYDRSLQFFGGVKTAWNGKGSVLNSVEADAGGSSSSYRAGLSLGGNHDPDQGTFRHLEWKVGLRWFQDPTGLLDLRKSVAIAQGFAATRAYGPLGFMFRFGASIEGGKLTAGPSIPGVLSDSPQRVLKSFVGSTWSYNRHIWNLSYGFQLGKGTDKTPVDYKKQIVDLSHQVRFLPHEHWPIQVDSHFNAGWILGSNAVIPVVERFFGGNLPADFVDSPLWKFPVGPQLRSFPHDRLDIAESGQPIGGTNFMAANLTIAIPVWSYPATPAMIRKAKPLEDGIHLGLQAAQGASLEDFRARTSLFPNALKQANAVLPDLERLRDRLSALTKRGLPDDLTAELVDLNDNYIAPTLADIAKAQKVPNNGLAWSICRRLSKNDPDTYPLAHLSAELVNGVAPGLDDAGLLSDAADLRTIAKALDEHKSSIAAALVPIESLAVVPERTLDAFRSDLANLSDVAQRLQAAAQVFLGAEAPFGTLAFDVVERSTSILNAAADPGPDPDPFDSLYVLTRLALGIGKLVPPQVEGAAEAADQLAAAVRKDHPGESQRISHLTTDLRANLAVIRSKLKAISTPSGERWARQQNQYFVRALDVAFREMNLAAVSPVVAFDAGRIGPQPAGVPAIRYGIGPGVRFSIVSFNVTLGYSFNPNRRGLEKGGAFFFSMDIADLFR